MIRIAIADDHAVVRKGVRYILGTAADMTVVAEAAQGSELLRCLALAPIDLVLLDMTMPGVSGLELIRRIRTKRHDLVILILSMHLDGQLALNAMRAGASGYLTKGCDPHLLLHTIRAVADGGRFLDPALVDKVTQAPLVQDQPPYRDLSSRELQVLQRWASGQSVNQIAENLSLSAKTVSTHKMRLMLKLSIDNNADLIRYALRHGLICD